MWCEKMITLEWISFVLFRLHCNEIYCFLLFAFFLLLNLLIELSWLDDKHSTTALALGCRAAPRESTAPMSESSNNTESTLFSTLSNEHVLFAGTLRDWCDPLLHGHAPRSVPLCPRCATCKCESLREAPNSSNRGDKHHHHPSCKNYRHHKRASTASTHRPIDPSKRRAISYDPSMTSSSPSPIIKQDVEHSASSPSVALRTRQKSGSKIPVRKSTATSTTPASENSSASSIAERRTSNSKTRIPRPISHPNIPSAVLLTKSLSIRSNTDEDAEDYDMDR